MFAHLALILFASSLAFGVAAAPLRHDVCGVFPATELELTSERTLRFGAAARLVLGPVVRRLKADPEERLVIAFKKSPGALESATMLYGWLQQKGVRRDQIKLVTHDDGSLHLAEGELKLVRLPQGTPVPVL